MSPDLIIAMTDEEFETYSTWSEVAAFKIENLGDGTGKLHLTDDLELITRPEDPA